MSEQPRRHLPVSERVVYTLARWREPLGPGGDTLILPIAATGKRTHELVKGSRLVVVEGGPRGVIWTHANPELVEFLR